MIHIIKEKDRIKALDERNTKVASLKVKSKDLGEFRMTEENFDQERFSELVIGQTLFEQNYIVLCDGLLKIIESQMDEIKSSQNHFIFVDAVASEASKAPNMFNIFSVSDALGIRDRKKLWIKYHEAVHNGFSAEDVFWKFVWQVKSMLIVAKEPNAKSMKPYTKQKSLGYAKNYSTQELENLSTKLVTLYHDARRGIVEFDIALEQLILSV